MQREYLVGGLGVNGVVWSKVPFCGVHKTGGGGGGLNQYNQQSLCECICVFVISG